MVGLGVIGGYTAFYSIYNHRCSDLLDDAEGRHNLTMEDLETRYKHAMEEHHECLNDESVMLELYELRGRLQSLESLEKDHQALKEAYDGAVTMLSALELNLRGESNSHEQLERDARQKAAQLDNLQGSLDACAQEKEKVVRNFEDCKDRLEDAVLNNRRQKREPPQPRQPLQDHTEL
eukprot:CAMPEP_0116997658 /NCGR_PEP_ID=MMETSP0472-20121206/1017_1 /TAXON_ID=693140 ORGANISM="Tiarina fusus, Strain LIS" /NCGR_SAMPLE_ID=MMETSP0472 /ASSEMBLY_ACC=CAM_ASM_000603 /LENGTH=177 /DNA_ID=CAMNT_0004696605 /DNA_START=209 /DNA_END=742 /DNA_ORIENTATION=-